MADLSPEQRVEALKEAYRRGLIDKPKLLEEVRKTGVFSASPAAPQAGDASRAGMEAQRDGMAHSVSGPAGQAPTRAERFAAMRDEMVRQEKPIASAVASAMRGIPFVGEGLDEFAGMLGRAMGDPMAGDAMRAGRRGFERANPGTATAAQIGTGLTTGAGMVAAAAPLTAAAPAGAGLQALTGLGAGTIIGGAEGAMQGALAADDGNRLQGALEGGVPGAIVGGGVGALAPLVGAGVRNAARYVRSRPDASLARSVGGSPPSAELVGRMLVNDDPAAIQRALDEAGPAGMMADAGPATSGLLDAAIQSAGPAGQIARRAIDQRAAEAGQEITSALDQFLGKPRGIRAAARDISGRTAQIRQQAYDAAYASPIDYASPQGRAIEGVLGRIPPKQAAAAIQEANDEMISRGLRNEQIMAQIDDAGNVVFQEMPNVRQLDAIKQALDKAGSETDIFGRATKDALRPQRLARELRKALGEAVPAYNRAVQLGGQKIAEDKALDTGRRILQDGFSREDVADALENAPPELVRQAKIGLRRQVEEVMANVKRSIGDPNMDAREGIAAMKALSSRATREKLEIVLGKTEAEALANRIDRASKAFELRANTAANSKTFARQQMGEAIREITEPGMVGDLLSGSPVQATRKLVQSMTNMTPEARRRVEEQIAGEIATILTGPRGQDAKDAAMRLIQSLEHVPATEELARRIGQAAGVTVGVGGYQAGTQMLQPQTPR
jgi:hypothetical protein